MKRRIAKLRDMVKRTKSKTLTIYYKDSLEEKVRYLKLKPGGITAFIEKAIEQVEIPEDELQAMRILNDKRML